LDKIEAKFD